MNVVPLRRSNDLRSYVQGLANRVRDGLVDGVLVIECKGGLPVAQHVSGIHTLALAGATLGIALDHALESALGALERRGLDVASTLDFGRRVLGIQSLPTVDLQPTPPTVPHALLSDVLGAAYPDHEHPPALDRERYEQLNTALWTSPVRTVSDFLELSITPEQWVALAVADAEGARKLAEAIRAGEPESWYVLFPDVGEGPLDKLDDCWRPEQRRLLDRLEEAARDVVEDVG